MKILHICLANLYIEGMGYQENIIPFFHAEEGNEVFVITARAKHLSVEQSEKEHYRDNIRIQYKERGGCFSRYGRFPGLYKELEAFAPDIIFVHGGQFISLHAVTKYCKKNRKVRLYIDQHADYYNTPVDSFRRKTAARYLYGHFIRKAARYTEKFWGVTPWRCQYLNDACGLPCLFKYWEGMQHVDVGGNCGFLCKNSLDEITQLIFELFNNKEKYNAMKQCAVEKAIGRFSYREIAKRAIEITN